MISITAGIAELGLAGDGFWAHPWGVANMAHVRFKEEFLEIFAGRIYEIKAGEGLRKIRASNARAFLRS
ncbi:MAG: hypothetical protein ABFS45_14585 [Pseudomonadota bacterium]